MDQHRCPTRPRQAPGARFSTDLARAVARPAVAPSLRYRPLAVPFSSPAAGRTGRASQGGRLGIPMDGGWDTANPSVLPAVSTFRPIRSPTDFRTGSRVRHAEIDCWTMRLRFCRDRTPTSRPSKPWTRNLSCPRPTRDTMGCDASGSGSIPTILTARSAPRRRANDTRGAGAYTPTLTAIASRIDSGSGAGRIVSRSRLTVSTLPVRSRSSFDARTSS